MIRFSPTHLAVGQLVPRLLAVGEDLPEDHAEAPDVALRGELPVHDALRRHPADGQHRASAHLEEGEGEGEGEEEGEEEEGEEEEEEEHSPALLCGLNS